MDQWAISQRSALRGVASLVLAGMLALFLSLGVGHAQQGRPQIQLPPGLDPNNALLIDLTHGPVLIELFPDKAPKHVERVKMLAERGFYNGHAFHRVIDEFMAQTGDPTGTGRGGSPLPNLQPEFNNLPHTRGTVSMARASDLDSANSQFFIMFTAAPHLDGQYTVFGKVIFGMESVDKLARGEPPLVPDQMLRVAILADVLRAMGMPEDEIRAMSAVNEIPKDLDIISPVLNDPSVLDAAGEDDNAANESGASGL